MIFNTIILALIQSVAEFLPISSSGHLILAKEFLHLNGLLASLSFDLVLHAGTLLSIVVYFRKELMVVLKDLLDKQKKSNLFWNILIATLPAILIGFLFSDTLENNFRGVNIVLVNLVVVAFLFLIIEKLSKHIKSLDELKPIHSLVIGFAQTLAFIPGISRSGITIVTALFLGYKRDDAAKFSFLLAVPATSLAVLKGINDLASAKETFASIEVYLIGFIVSSICGYLAIKYLINFLKNHTLEFFAYYRILLAVLFVIVVYL